ncbi:hypothetical protein Tco_1432063 [Tanacetum coccineum]
MDLIGLLPIYLDREEEGGSYGSLASPSLFYFEDPSEEDFRTRKRWLGIRIGSVVSAIAECPRGSSSASRREECHQLGRYWPLTTHSPDAQAPRFKFVILTVSSAPPGA